MKHLLFIIVLFFFCSVIKSQEISLSDYRWTRIDVEGKATGRHENAFIEYKGKFYLLGGRGINPVNVFDPESNSWVTKEKSPLEIHHFQAVVYEDAIYMVGAMTGGYPKEKPLENIWIYYPETDKWEQGPEIPPVRRRGGAGIVLYKDKIYMVGGIKFGHTSGTTNMFDSYDLKTGKWEILTDAPHIRDHFPAIVAGNKLYCIGGRNTSVHYPDNFGAFFEATIPQIDVYDFDLDQWFSLKEELPVPTAAGGIVKVDKYLIYIGGEGSQEQAYNHTQCLDTETGKCIQLAPLFTGRHGSGAILLNNEIYIAAGSPNKGGGNMSSIEVFSPNHKWEKLFNGQNLEGWEIKCQPNDENSNFWSVENGSVYCNSLGSKEHGYVWLQSEKEYKDFELRLKFKVSRNNLGNAGVQVRSRYFEKAKVESAGAGWLDGPQVDIDPHTPFRIGLIYDETRTEKRWIYPSLPDWQIEKEDVTPEKTIFYWEDQETGWNDMAIICKGTKIKTIVNNIVVTNFDGAGILDDEGHIKLKVGLYGHIALQLHKNSENEIWYKDIELLPIKQNY